MSITTPNAGHATVVAAEAAELVEMPSGPAFQLLADASATEGALGANRLSLTTGADGAEPHYHALSAELFYVLDGAAEFLLKDQMITVVTGGLVVVPPRMPHAFGAAPATSADLLVVIAPGIERFGYFRRLQRIALGLDLAESLLPEQERYDVHLVQSAAWQTARTT